MRRYLKLWPLAVVLAGVLGWQGYKADLRREGAMNERIHARELTIAALAKQGAALAAKVAQKDTVYHTDTLRLAGTRSHYDGVVNNLPDALKADPAVKEILHAADAERNACSVVVQTCEQRVALRDLRIAVLDSANRTYEAQLADVKKRPGFFTRAAGKVPWILGGVVAGRVLIH